MIIDVGGIEAHASTGGVAVGNDGPVLVLVHGAGMDGTVWQQQTRFLAYRGIRTLAVDLPGHGRSEGAPLTTVAEMTAWLHEFIVAADIVDAAGGVHIGGHSMGTFIALQLAADHPELVTSLILLGTADAMAVHPALLDAAANNLPAAAALMAAWGLDKQAHIGSNPTPGMWMLGGSRALVENSSPGVLSTDFAACMAFAGAEQAAANVSCPVTVVMGTGDKMTPPKAGAKVAAALSNVEVVTLAETGHTMMLEKPRAIRAILQDSVHNSAPTETATS